MFTAPGEKLRGTELGLQGHSGVFLTCSADTGEDLPYPIGECSADLDAEPQGILDQHLPEPLVGQPPPQPCTGSCTSRIRLLPSVRTVCGLRICIRSSVRGSHSPT